MKPACMSDEDYTAWQGLNRRVHAVSDRAATPCWDCTAGHALEMRAVDRCDGTPGEPEDRPELVPPERLRGLKAGVGVSAKVRHERAIKAAEVAYGMSLTGMSGVAIARELGIAQNTVSKYIRLIREREAA